MTGCPAPAAFRSLEEEEVEEEVDEVEEEEVRTLGSEPGALVLIVAGWRSTTGLGAA